MPKPSDKVPKYNFHGAGHVYMDIGKYDDAMKSAAWIVRHSLQRNHPYNPEGCGGCRLIQDFLLENPERETIESFEGHFDDVQAY